MSFITSLVLGKLRSYGSEMSDAHKLDLIEELRDERADQGKFASDETIRKFGREQGADFILIGTVDSVLDMDDGEEVRFYQVDLTLVDIETNEKVWIEQHEIKKYVTRSRYSG